MPEPASVWRRVTGKGHSFIRCRAFALNRATDDPAPSLIDLGDEAIAALELGSVEVHRFGMKMGVDMRTSFRRQR